VLLGAPSPDGVNIAFVFRRDCGGAIGSSTHVSVIDIHHPLRSGPGNVLIVSGNQTVKAVWRGPTTLVVSGFHDPGLANAQVGRVTIEFAERTDH
jgi:hypothetical protein